MHCIGGSKHVSHCAFSANATPLCSSTGSKLEEPSSSCCLGQATASSGSTHFSSRHPKNSGINTSDKCTKDQCTHAHKHTSLDKHASCNNSQATTYTNNFYALLLSIAWNSSSFKAQTAAAGSAWSLQHLRCSKDIWWLPDWVLGCNEVWQLWRIRTE